MKRRANPPSIHAPLGIYTHQIEITDERLLVVAGQVGMLSDGEVPEAVADQLRVALENIRLNLEAASMTTRDLVKLTLYLTEELAVADRREILEAFVGADPPTATLVYVSRLAAPALKVEVEAIASAVR
jgi:2-iminobutanoate/2-iminopropanoate deaminase